MPELPEIPDAVYAPTSLMKGAHTLLKVGAVADIVEPILGVDRLKRELAHMRAQPNGMLFCTKDPHDTLLFPKSHPQAGQDRYHWVEKENGMQYGYLMEDARA